MTTDLIQTRSQAALAAGSLAVITGGASGIGRAVAGRLVRMGLRVAILDRHEDAVRRAVAELGSPNVEGLACDVADANAMSAVAARLTESHGAPALLMNNAGLGSNPGQPWENLDGWRGLIDVNLWGVINGVQAFVPAMIDVGRPALVVNTGSKQGITTPPGNLAYNMSKSALRTYTEGLEHALRNLPGSRISAHLLIPGFTFTGITEGATEKPPGAWAPEQVADFMLDGLKAGDFYLLCPDNETTRDTDVRRMRWSIGDITENRPALSRWHPAFADAFKQSLRD